MTMATRICSVRRCRLRTESSLFEEVRYRPRLIPLALVPFVSDGETRVLVKSHPKWHDVLPSAEVGLSADHDRCAQGLCEVLEYQALLGGWTDPMPWGGAISFKRSPTSGEPTCYVFALYLFPATPYPPSSEWTGGGNTMYRLTSATKIASLAEAGESKNGDVFKLLGRLFRGNLVAIRQLAAPTGL